MEKIEERFAEPKRQAGIAILIILLKFLKQTIKSFWPIALSFFIGGKSDRFETVLGILVIIISVLNLGGSLLSYFRYYIQLEKGAIIIDKGVLRRSKTNVPFERIQSINFKQNLVHQFFGVVSVEIDTAGASKAELTIDAIDKKEAEALREYIMSVRSEILQEKAEPTAEEQKSDEQTILHLSVSDLIKIGVSQNHLRSMAILFGFALTILNDLNESFEGVVEEELSSKADLILNSQWLIFLFFVLAILVVSFAYSLITTTLGNYDLKLKLNNKGLKLIKGLLNREEISINKNKIQIVSWGDNPIRRMFNMWTLSLEQASSENADKLKSKIKVPGCYLEQVDEVLGVVFPKMTDYVFSKHKVSILLKYRLLFFVSVLPFLLSLVAFLWIEWLILWFIIWPIFTSIYIHIYFQKRSFEISEEVFKNNTGAFGTRFELTQLHKVQAIEITQSWYQRRKNLANIELTTASGELSVPFIPFEMAIALEKYILYRVETDQREWM